MKKLSLLVCVGIAGLAGTVMAAPGDTLVGDPFILGYNGWTDQSPATVGGGPPNWGIHLRDGALQEASDGHGGTSGTARDGKYTPYVMVNDFQTPTEYTFSSTLASFDNDGFGVVFGFQDNQNYFRVGLRNQSSGSLGFGEGVSVQKVVGGTITQIGQDRTTFLPPVSRDDVTFTNVDVDVQVNGTSWAVYINDKNHVNQPILSGNDAALTAGKIGVLSWFQLQDSPTLATGQAQWGTELRSTLVKDAGGATLFQDNFGTVSQAAVSPVPWRPLTMTKSGGASAIADKDDLGNFRLDFRKGGIAEDSNGFEWATQDAPNIDFTAPAIVVDRPGASSMSNYKMQVRLKSGDDDGIGLLVRVQDSDNFYRVNFARQTINATNAWERAPRGMSIQKFQDGTWTELFRDDQANPAFVYTNGAGALPFDVSVTVVDNTIKVHVINDPDGAATVIDYPLVIDSSDPLLNGSVGFTNWGNGDASAASLWSAFGGIAGTPLVVEVPEPATCLLAGLGGLFLVRRKRFGRA